MRAKRKESLVETELQLPIQKDIEVEKRRKENMNKRLIDSSSVALSTMSTSAQSQRQKKRQQSFCSRDTEKAYVEGLEDGYRDGLQGGWSHGFDSGYEEEWRQFKERWAALLTTVIIVILVALYYTRLTSSQKAGSGLETLHYMSCFAEQRLQGTR